jgi:hypothetical protein
MVASSPVVASEPLAPLFELAHADLYRENAFRMVGLKADAPARVVSRQFARLKMAERLGGGLRGIPTLLPLHPLPSPDAVRAALERLRDPERRFLDELFWLWPEPFGAGDSDPTLAALDEGRLQDVRAAWTRAIARSSTARHNLAVLEHLTALDLEHLAVGCPLTPDQVTLRDGCWEAALGHWRQLLDDEEFWDDLALRVRQREEPQLTAATVQSVRVNLPEALLTVNAQLAIRAVEQNQDARVKRQVALVTGSGFPAAAAEQAFRRALYSVRERIKHLCQQARQTAQSDPEQGFKAAMRLHKQGKPLLSIVARLLPVQHVMRVGAHDDVALGLMACVVSCGNRTRVWDSATWWLLGEAKTIAQTESAQERIKANLEIVQANCGIPVWLRPRG